MSEISITKHVNYGDVILVVSSYNGWQIEQGIEMEWNQGDVWSTKFDCQHPITYRYVIVHKDSRQIVEWENDNRLLNQVGFVNDIWGYRQVRIELNYSGSGIIQIHTSFQSLQMIKQDDYYYQEILIPNYQINKFSYRYSIDNEWERIPSRVLSQPINNQYRNVDSDLNLNLDFDQINHQLYVGAYLYPKDFQILQENQIDSILNLQTDDDLHIRNLPHNHFQIMEQHAKERGILYVHYGINDCDSNDFLRKGKKAYQLLSKLLQKGRVYVHCTYGIQRSVQTIILHLTLNNKMDLNDAIELVKRKRRRSRPMKELLRHIVNS